MLYKIWERYLTNCIFMSNLGSYVLKTWLNKVSNWYLNLVVLNKVVMYNMRSNFSYKKVIMMNCPSCNS
ncbi:MAG: hypothetical protein QM487_08710, partial [Candidatus Marithrix sp.]